MPGVVRKQIVNLDFAETRPCRSMIGTTLIVDLSYGRRCDRFAQRRQLFRWPGVPRRMGHACIKLKLLRNAR